MFSSVTLAMIGHPLVISFADEFDLRCKDELQTFTSSRIVCQL